MGQNGHSWRCEIPKGRGRRDKGLGEKGDVLVHWHSRWLGQCFPARRAAPSSRLHTRSRFSLTHRDPLTPEGPGERGSQEVQKTTPQKEGTKNPGAGLGGGATDGPKSVCASCLPGCVS